MSAMQILQLLQMVLGIVEQSGINYKKFMAMREQARAEGRELTQAELQALADDAQDAIDKL